MTKELKYVNADKIGESPVIPVNVMKETRTVEYVQLIDAIESATKLTTMNGFIILLKDGEYYVCLLMKVNDTSLTYIEGEVSVINGTYLVKDVQSNENAYNMLANIVLASSYPSIGAKLPDRAVINQCR